MHHMRENAEHFDTFHCRCIQRDPNCHCRESCLIPVENCKTCKRPCVFTAVCCLHQRLSPPAKRRRGTTIGPDNPEHFIAGSIPPTRIERDRQLRLEWNLFNRGLQHVEQHKGAQQSDDKHSNTGWGTSNMGSSDAQERSTKKR